MIPLGRKKIQPHQMLAASCLRAALIGAVVIGLDADPSQAEDWDRAGATNIYAMPGLVEMPTARRFPDAQAAVSWAQSGMQQGVTLTFQVTPRATAAFRYLHLPGFGELYDRSFDLHYQLMDEGQYRPAVAIGIRDLLGTGVLSGEYLVASKAISPRLSADLGIGWGRLGSYGSFDNPFGLDTRENDFGRGGKPGFSQWFRGPAAVFGGLTWQASKDLAVAFEYSSDAHAEEVANGAIDRKSPFNLGLRYSVNPGTIVSADFLHGSKFALSATFTFNPKTDSRGSDFTPAPLPVRQERGDFRFLPETTDPAIIQQYFDENGLDLKAFEVNGSAATLGFESRRYRSGAQAVGRAARLLSNLLPDHVSTFVLRLEQDGMPVTEVSLTRSDLAASVYMADPAAAMLGRAEISPAVHQDVARVTQSPLDIKLRPYLSTEIFDPDEPLRIDAGLRLTGELTLTPGLSMGVGLRGKVVGNRDNSVRSSNSVLPHVRSDASLYAKEGPSGIDYWTVDYLTTLRPDIFGRLSVGYLEPMFAGVSGEVLWMPSNRRWALGLEVNRVRQRDRDGLLGTGDYDYEVTTGHASFYYKSASGFDYQLDVGRYLASDMGATLSVDRTFENGWRIGAFATLTDVSFDDFGEGSFDKGIRITVPLSWMLGRTIRETTNFNIRSIQRDGGARLDVRNRLYGLLADVHSREVVEDWGTFWK